MKIAIDIDDTLTNTKDNQLKLWKEYIAKYPNPNYSEELPHNINEFDAGEYIDEFWKINRYHLSFESTYKQDTSQIIDKLKSDGHELCIVTSRPDSGYDDLKGRIEKALKENEIHIDTIYTDARDKGSYCKEHNFDLLIDDNIKQIESAKAHGLQAILFNENDSYKGLQTTTWKELYNMIKELNK
jgi:FMN phosphatase YigB (HAD superfamily)